MTKAVFSGPVIDRDCFEPGLPDHYESDIPYFDVRLDKDPLGDRWRFWFEEKRGGWVWDGRRS